MTPARRLSLLGAIGAVLVVTTCTGPSVHLRVGDSAFTALAVGQGLLVQVALRLARRCAPRPALAVIAAVAVGMREETYGWNLEMLMRVAAAGIASEEVAVGQGRRSGGVSKVSGNPRPVAAASWSLATTFLRLAAALRRG